jgi:hypothetical protein
VRFGEQDSVRFGEHLNRGRTGCALVPPTPLDDTSEVAALAVFHDDVEHALSLVDEALVVADDVITGWHGLEDMPVAEVSTSSGAQARPRTAYAHFSIEL